MNKYRVVLIFSMSSVFILSGCSSQPTPPPIPTPPITSLKSWQSAALQDWSNNAVENVLGPSHDSKYTHNWSGCKPRFILTDFEVGFCQGFHLSKWEFENNMTHVLVQNFSSAGYKDLPTSLTSIQRKCGSGENAYVAFPVQDYWDADFDYLRLPESANIEDWYEGCISGFSFQIKLRELYEKTPAAKTALEAAKAAYKAQKAEEDANSSTSANEDQPNSGSEGGEDTGDDSDNGYWVRKCKTITVLNPDYYDPDPSSIVDNLRGPSRFITRRQCADVWVKN